MEKAQQEQAHDSALVKTILIVEDDRTHRNLMQKILHECEFETVPAENGAIALSKLDETSDFDLILMDLDMPELNGYETARQIRIKELELRKKHIPIIAFTANRAPGDEEKCLAAGMNAYLSKDIWMPKWRSTLIDNLQGFIVGDFDPEDLQHSANASPVNTEEGFDLEDFDEQALGQVVMLLKDELSIAIDEYLEDAAAYIRDIKKGLQERDPEKTARGSHPLKSNSKSFGLIAVSKIATAINTEAMNGKLERVETLLPQLEEAFSLGEKKLRSTVKCYGY